MSSIIKNNNNKNKKNTKKGRPMVQLAKPQSQRPKKNKAKKNKPMRLGTSLTSPGSWIKKHNPLRAVGEWADNAVGSLVDNYFGKIFGSGAYEVRSNTVLSEGLSAGHHTMQSGPPLFAEHGTIRVRHREFLRTIVSSQNFETTTIDINPGLSDFTWLSRIAAHYEEYEISGLVFEFCSTEFSAVAGPDPSAGVVAMATQYDVLDTPFATKQEMLAYEWSVATVPYRNSIHPVECDLRDKIFKNQYVRTSAPPVNSDQRLYDLGRFQISTQGQQTDGDEIGDLWVSYDVILRYPKYNPAANNGLAGVYEAGNPIDTNLAQGNPGNRVLVSGDDLVTFGLGPNANNVLFNQPGRYQVIYRTSCANPGNILLNPAGLTAIGSATVDPLGTLVGTPRVVPPFGSQNSDLFTVLTFVINIPDAGNSGFANNTLTQALFPDSCSMELTIIETGQNFGQDRVGEQREIVLTELERFRRLIKDVERSSPAMAKALDVTDDDFVIPSGNFTPPPYLPGNSGGAASKAQQKNLEEVSRIKNNASRGFRGRPGQHQGMRR